MVLLLKEATGSLNFKSRGSICRGGAGFTSAVVPVYSRSYTCTNCTDGFVTFSRRPTGSGKHFLSFLPALQRGTVLKNAIPCRSSNARNVSNQDALFSGKKTRELRDLLRPMRVSLKKVPVAMNVKIRERRLIKAIFLSDKRGKSNLPRSSRRPQYQ